MINPKPGDEGRWVTYIPSAGPREAGIISSWNDKVVFVRYHTGDTAAATDRRDLEWGLVGNVRNRIAATGRSIPMISVTEAHQRFGDLARIRGGVTIWIDVKVVGGKWVPVYNGFFHLIGYEFKPEEQTNANLPE